MSYGLPNHIWSHGLRLLLAAALLAGFVTSAELARVAHAAILNVTRFDDPPPDGCQIDDCSLREAIIAANATPGLDTISLRPGAHTLTRPPADPDTPEAGDLDVTDDLTLEGAGVTPESFSGIAMAPGLVDRVFEVHAAASVQIRGVSLSNGKAGSDSGGGILNRGTLTLTESRIGGNGAMHGGGIFNDGAMTVVNSTIASNEAVGTGGGIANSAAGVATVISTTLSANVAAGDGGGLFNRGLMTIAGSAISFNEARGKNMGTGGGLFNGGDGNLLIRDSTVSNNLAEGAGGGGIITHGPLTVVRSTISHNHGTSQGGGIMVRSLRFMIINSTLAHNMAEQGGALKLEAFGGERKWDIQHSTIVFNSAGVGGGIQSFGEARLRNTVLSLNTPSNCSFSLESQGYNLLGDMSGCPAFVSAETDIVLPDDALAPFLAGFTQDGTPGRGHVPLLPENPALDTGICTDGEGNPVPSDQLGTPRPRGTACDIGAIEFLFPPSLVLDDFTRPNASRRLGAAWAGSDGGRGGYRVVNPALDVEQGGPIYWRADRFGSDQEAFITLVNVDRDGFHQSVLLKVQDNARGRPNWRRGAIAVFYAALEGQVGIETYVPHQGWMTLASFDAVLQDGDQLGARALADGTVATYVNGQLLGTASTGAFFAGKGGRIGLWFIEATDALLDDFGGGNFTP